MTRKARRTLLVPSQVPTMDLLYAHGLLCDWVRGRVLEKLHAQRHCEVINNYQRVLRQYLVPGTTNFQVVATRNIGFYTVEPIGGYGHHGREKEKPRRADTERGCAFGSGRRLHRDSEDED